MDPIEVEFIGEDTTVGVIPNFSFEAIHLISGTIGPFRAGLCTWYPHWLWPDLLVLIVRLFRFYRIRRSRSIMAGDPFEKTTEMPNSATRMDGLGNVGGHQRGRKEIEVSTRKLLKENIQFYCRYDAVCVQILYENAE